MALRLAKLLSTASRSVPSLRRSVTSKLRTKLCVSISRRKASRWLESAQISDIEIQHQQLVAVAVAEHVNEGVVAIEQLAFRVGDVNAFLHLLEEQTIFFFGGAALGHVANDVDGSFLRAALLGVRRGGNDREAAEAGVGAFGKFFVAAHRAVGAASPLAQSMRQSGVAGVADDICSGHAQLFEQDLVGFDDAIVGVVGEDDVVNRVEGVDPLALRAQVLLEQAEIFDGDAELLGASLQKIEFFRSPVAASGIAEQQQSEDSFVAGDRNRYELADFLGLKTKLVFGAASLAGGDLRSGLGEKFLDIFVDRRKSGVAQEIGGKPDGVSGDQLFAFDAGGTRRRARASAFLIPRWPTEPRCHIAERWPGRW